MTDTLSIGATRSVADGRISTFKRVLIVNLVVQSAVAAGFLFRTDFMLSLFGFDGAPGNAFPRIWAGTLILASAFQIPACLDPVHQRLNILTGLGGRAMMTAIFLSLGGAFYVFALYDGLFLVLLYLAFHRLVVAELTTRP